MSLGLGPFVQSAVVIALWERKLAMISRRSREPLPWSAPVRFGDER